MMLALKHLLMHVKHTMRVVDWTVLSSSFAVPCIISSPFHLPNVAFYKRMEYIT